MRNFVATVKERDVGQPCFVVLELTTEPQSRHIVLNFPEGTTIEDAEEVAKLLTHKIKKVSIGL